jgi:hypothetical protein
VSVLRLPRQVLDDSFSQLRTCGAGRAECVVYWCADRGEPGLLTRAVHPLHRAGRGWYEVDSAWITQFFLHLRREGQKVLVQVHTHPQEAGHSETDDQFSLAPAPGFMSLVIPDFGAGQAGFRGAALVRMRADGSWEPTCPEDVFAVE